MAPFIPIIAVAVITFAVVVIMYLVLLHFSSKKNYAGAIVALVCVFSISVSSMGTFLYCINSENFIQYRFAVYDFFGIAAAIWM